MEELLRLTKENNYMLKQIFQYLQYRNSVEGMMNEDFKEFLINVAANGFSNR